jgi:amino acid adenylation domain-containing protein
MLSQAPSEVEGFYVLPEQLLRAVTAAVAGRAARESPILLAIFEEVLRRFTGQESIAVRFVLEDATEGIREHDGSLSLHQDLDQVEASPGASPNLVLNLATDAEFSFQHVPDSSERAARSATSSSMHWAMQRSASGLNGVIRFDPKTWDLTTIKLLLSSFEHLLAAALTQADIPLAKLNILTPADISTLDSWNDTARSYPRARVDELFEQQAVERPNHVAISFLSQETSYADLSIRVRQLALRLASLGVTQGTLVGVCMDRHAELVVALLGIFRAGGAYLPLDPDFPPERIEFVLEDARPLVVITEAHLQQRFSFPSCRVLLMNDATLEPESTVSPEDFSAQPSTLDDLAYVLYTSGSTGKPKGVQIRHRALTNILAAVCQDIGLEASDVVLATTTISFDISTFEIFGPLIIGAQLVMAPRAVATNGELLARSLSQYNATVLQATPSGWQVLLESGWAGKADLKMVTVGEPLTQVLAQRLLERGSALWNLYGPTEATVYTTGCQVYKDTNKVLIGRPLANQTAYVLDHRRQRLPIGAIGELYVGGIGVGAGYLNRPELTAEKFLADPFSSEPEARLYSTGDLARFLPNGEIDLLGRADNQVKLRGYRIELEEVEAVLDGHPGIVKSVARVMNVGDDQKLVAYVIPRSSILFQEAELREHALRRLPWYMVPTAFMVKESFVLSPAGKVDRKALPAFASTQSPEKEKEPDVAVNSLQAAILQCWRHVLGMEDLGPEDNFFHAGGHSLLAMRMMAELNQAVGYELPIGLLVEAPTARQFADAATRSKDLRPRHLVTIQPEGSLPPLYLVHHVYGNVLIYRDLASHFAPHRPVFGFEPPVDLVHRAQRYSFEDLASIYVSEIRERHTAGPIHLGGFSSGSAVAFEMARQLKDLGYAVGVLGLIDGEVAAPGPRMPLLVRYAKKARGKFYRIVFKLGDEVALGSRWFVQKRLNFVLEKYRMRALKGLASPGGLTVYEALSLAESDYQPKPYSGSAVLIRFRKEAAQFDYDPYMGWSGLTTGGLVVIDVDGNHDNGLDLSVARIASILEDHSRRMEASFPVS